MKKKLRHLAMAIMCFCGLFMINFSLLSGDCWKVPGNPNTGHCNEWVITWPSGAEQTTLSCDNPILEQDLDCVKDYNPMPL